MREILFKAKDLNGKWVEGSLKDVGGIQSIITFDAEACKRDEAYGWQIYDYAEDVTIQLGTVCQYTGLTDKNGNKIWECDIVKYIPTKTILQVLYINGAFAVTHIPNGYSPINWEIEYEGEDYDFAISNDYLTRLEVIGNIFDNPELLTND
jgi:uncharacterized phage protein (TIGR01671 family)